MSHLLVTSICFLHRYLHILIIFKRNKPYETSNMLFDFKMHYNNLKILLSKLEKCIQTPGIIHIRKWISFGKGFFFLFFCFFFCFFFFLMFRVGASGMWISRWFHKHGSWDEVNCHCHTVWWYDKDSMVLRRACQICTHE